MLDISDHWKCYIVTGSANEFLTLPVKYNVFGKLFTMLMYFYQNE